MVLAIVPLLGLYGTLVTLPPRFSFFQRQNEAFCFSSVGMFTKFTLIKNRPFFGVVYYSMLVNTVRYGSCVLQCQLGDHRLGDLIQDLCVLYPADIVFELQPTNCGDLLRLDHRLSESKPAVRHIAGFQLCVAG